jgi:hypothetical protein
VAAVAPNVNASISFAISVVSLTPCLLNHKQAVRSCAVIASAPAGRRIAALEGVKAEQTLLGLLVLKNLKFALLRKQLKAVVRLTRQP